MKIGNKVRNAAIISECFCYKNGRIFWLQRPVTHFKSERIWASWVVRNAGREITSKTGRGYIRARLQGKNVYAHHIVWALHTGLWPTQTIDHINHDITDNRIENLREVSRLENSWNAARKASNTSGVNGVHWLRREQKWQAQIRVKGKRKSLGYYDNIADAKAAREAADTEYGFHKNHGKSNDEIG